MLMNRKYEGNFRELENILRGAIISARINRRDTIQAEDFSLVRESGPIAAGSQMNVNPSLSDENIMLKDIIDYANRIRSSVVEQKVMGVIKSGRDLKSVYLSEGQSEKGD